MDSEFSLIIKYLYQQLSTEEKSVLSKWVNLSNENKEIFSEICKLKLLREYNNQNDVANTALALNRVQSKIYRKTARYKMNSIMKYAAMIVVILSISLFGWTLFTQEKYTTFAVAENHDVKKIKLEDGSTIWLSSKSEVRVPKSFSSTRRQISLKGKAFLDVKKDSLNPFLVSTDYIDLKVMGTSFDISVNKQEKSVETILVSGKVILQDKKHNDIIEMSPGEKVDYRAFDNNYTISTVDANMLTSWHLDQIKFENATLREIVNKLSLIYDVNINLESTKLAERKYRYVINKEETLKEVLDILSYLAPIKYTIEDNEVFISE